MPPRSLREIEREVQSEGREWIRTRLQQRLQAEADLNGGVFPAIPSGTEAAPLPDGEIPLNVPGTDHDGWDAEMILCPVKNFPPAGETEARLKEVQRQLIHASRQAGMAEAANHALHNVGNVLNSVNIASSLVLEHLKKSKAGYLARVAAMLEEHADDLGSFITTDSKGRQIPGFLNQLAEQLAKEQAFAISELEGLRQNIQHLAEIVARQQSYAKISGQQESVKPGDLMDHALAVSDCLRLHPEIEVITNYDDVPPVLVEKHKVLQILVNLVQNAIQSCDDSGRQTKKIILKISRSGREVHLAVADNGVGILPENLARIFSLGFTTRKDGHGFGLHGAALMARELGGLLTVRSSGPGQGATFSLGLPLPSPKSDA